MYVNEIILVTSAHSRAKIVDQGILTYDGYIDEVPEEYHDYRVNSIYPEDNAIVILLRQDFLTIFSP